MNLGKIRNQYCFVNLQSMQALVTAKTTEHIAQEKPENIRRQTHYEEMIDKCQFQYCLTDIFDI